MIVGSVTARGGASATLQLSGPHSLAGARGKLIIIIMDNTNREQFIIAPLSPGCVSTSRVARPDTIIQWRGDVGEGACRGEEGKGGASRGKKGGGERGRGLMRF